MAESELVQLKFKIRFEGRDADDHRLEAYPAAKSIEGLVWALSLVIHFGVTGKIRNKGNLSASAKVYISPPKRGSYINDLNVVVQNNPFLSIIIGGYAVNTLTPYINSLVGLVFGEALGVVQEIPRSAKKFLDKLEGKDLKKLINRIEPPLTRAHAVIGKTSDTITLRGGRKEIAVLDIDSKDFLEARLQEGFQILDTNITSFNVLTGNGRLFHPEVDSTIPFSLGGQVIRGTPDALITSMRQYSLGRMGTIRITAQRVETSEHKLKKVLISSAEEVPFSDWVDGKDPLRSKRE